MSVISSATRLLLTLSLIKGIGPAALRKASIISGFEELSIEELAAKIPKIARVLASNLSWQIVLDSAEKQIEEAQRHHARILSPLDEDYPKLLAATKDDPFILYVQGTLAKVPEQSVTIIGTRQPTRHGEEIAARITRFFVERNWSIVSGLAIGCDGIAHQAALDAGGHTVAVLAHGLHMVAPAKHKKLALDILSAGGALVSEYPFGQGVQNQQYVKRDRTQAGMAQGVVMVQSDVKGGSLHASRASLDYGRWLAIPYPTAKDRKNMEPKVQANLMIADGTDSQRTDLLHCLPAALKHIQILRSREDYLLMTRLAENITFNKISPKSYINEVIPELSLIECSSKGDVSSNAQFSSPDQCADLRPLPNIGPAKHSYPAGLTEAPKSPDEEDHKQLLFQTPSCGILRCRVSLGEGISGGAKITQMPSASSSEYKCLEALINDRSALVVLSARLKYIQDQLDAINMVHHVHEKSVSDGEGMLFLHFSVEDIVTQMKRAADLLHLLEKPNVQAIGDHATLGVDETKFSLADGPRSKLADMFLSEIFESQQDFLSHSFSFALAPNCSPNRAGVSLSGSRSGHSADVSCKHEIVDIYLDDLIHSLNHLIAKILYADNHHSTK